MSSTLSHKAHRVAAAVTRRIPGIPAPYQWKPAHSITNQRFSFSVGESVCIAESDYSTPMYETIMEIVDYDCYQLSRLGPPPAGACIVDVGANVGIATLVLRQRFGLPVYSFEPIPANVAQLESNVAANDLDRITVVPRAIGRRTGTVLADMSYEASVSPRAAVDIDSARATNTVPIDMVSLADALAEIPEPIFLMKLDCEGAEFEIVDQIDGTVRQRIQNLTFEVHNQPDGRNMASLRSQLDALGYRTEVKPEMRGRAWMNHVLALSSP